MVKPVLINSATSGIYSLPGEGELTLKTAVPNRWQPGRVDTTDEKWQILELRLERLTLIAPVTIGVNSRDEDTLHLQGVKK